MLRWHSVRISEFTFLAGFLVCIGATAPLVHGGEGLQLRTLLALMQACWCVDKSLSGFDVVEGLHCHYPASNMYVYYFSISCFGRELVPS